VLPDELKGWNWGAFLLGPIWGLFNKVWIALILAVVWILPLLPEWLAAPIVLGGVGLIIYLGFKGNELAWRGRRWEGIDHFRRVQQSWATWGLLVAIAQGILLIIGIAYRGG
jgi:predicted membrane chloride channel (bestrophin family)